MCPLWLNATRYYAASLALEAVFEDAARLDEGFAQCRFRLFMYDERRSRLIAVLRPNDASEAAREWEPGKGVTGVAYETREYAIAVGAATHDDTFHLDDDAKLDYADLTEVAAAPVFNASNHVIGVLSVSNTTSRLILSRPLGRRVHIQATSVSARILVDLLGWRSDQ